MRVRTEEKRRDIVNAAAELFEEHGFDRTSMSMIAERFGGSKATLYGYFRAKEELLEAVLIYDVTEQAERLMTELLSHDDLHEGLTQLGVAYMTRRLSSVSIANIRNVASQPAPSALGKHFFESVVEPAWKRLAARFESLMDQGRLNRADPWLAAMHWKGLNEWDLFEKRLLGVIEGAKPKELEKIAGLAADAFLQLYGASPKRPQKKRRA